MGFKSIAILIAVILIIGLLAYGGYYYSNYTTTKRITERLDFARTKFHEQQYDDAIKVLLPILDANKRSALLPEVMVLTARCYYEKAVNLDGVASATDLAAFKQKELNLYASLLEEYPSSPHLGEALMALAKDDVDAMRFDEAQKKIDQFIRESGEPDLMDNALYLKARIAWEHGAVEETKKHLTAIISEYPKSDISWEAQTLLGKINLEELYSPEMQEGDTSYAVQQGDVIDSIARRFNISSELIMKCNRITDPRRLSPGRRLKIPNLNLRIVVNKSNNTLTLFNHDRFFKSYRVRTGKTENATPNGEYVIENKMKEPQFTDQDGRVFAGGSPDNELGARWLGFIGRKIGIHEAIHPETVGTYSSNGCVGLVRDEVIELYDLVSIGTPIEVIGEMRREGIR